MRNLFLSSLVFAACGGDVTADQGCATLAQGLCSKLDQCVHPIIASQFGDVATCTARQKLNCIAGLKAPNNKATPARAQECGSTVGSLSCGDVFTRKIPSACKSDPGTLADGSPCGQDGQCTSTYCKKSMAGATCGTCAARQVAGGGCQRDDDCDYSLACGGNHQCTAWVAAGGTCDGNHPCAAPLVCNGGTCATPAGAGQNCMHQPTDTCDTTKGLFCNGVASGVCQMFQYANAGQACGFTFNPISFTACTASSTCSSSTGTGTCVAPAADGANCSVATNVNCTPPANCLGGVCTLPDYASCH